MIVKMIIISIQPKVLKTIDNETPNQIDNHFFRCPNQSLMVAVKNL